MPPAQRQALERTLDRMTRNPGAVDLKRMQGTANQWRVRQGHWRAIVVFDQARHVITVQDIGQRKDVYR
jgi:mRNA-degrading endonuclease RelE of RelBE toxin-antitoxin system